MQKVKFQGWNCNVLFNKYHEGKGYRIDLIDADDGTPVAVATLNVPDIELESDEVIIKDYSENKGMHDALIKYGIIKHTNKFVKLSQFITAPIAKIIH